MSAFPASNPLTLAAAVLALGLGACASAAPDRLPQEAHRITVRESREHVEIAVRRGQNGLSFANQDALRALSRDYDARGHGPIEIALPIGGRNEADAVALAAEARRVLNEGGLAYRHILGARYDARGLDAAPLVVSYTRYVAEGPSCGQIWDDFNVTFSGGNTRNFGCAHQANLAAMIADPRDLVAPRDADPPDVGRRLGALDAYRTGETTVTERADDEGATVSNAVD